MNGMMLVGTKLVLHPGFDPEKCYADNEAHRATIFDGVPAMYMFMLNDPAMKTAYLSSLNRCCVGGQTMAVATMEAVEAAFTPPRLSCGA